MLPRMNPLMFSGKDREQRAIEPNKTRQIREAGERAMNELEESRSQISGGREVNGKRSHVDGEWRLHVWEVRGR